MKKNQTGFGLVELLLVVAVISILGLLGWKFFAAKDSEEQSSGQQAMQNENSEELTTTHVSWSFDYQSEKWKPSSTPPSCKDPFTFDISPVDMSRATSVLYPGQTRGGHYKAHGGVAFDNNTDNQVTVVMPYDAYLVGGSRYIESGEVQYIFDFESECGIAIRFDHLATLSDKFAGIANQYLPEPKVDDSRGTKIEPMLVKSGEIIATAIGYTMPRLNVGMDFGVYDYRQRNTAARNATYRQAHASFSASNYHAVCWFDMLPGGDAVTANALPSRDQAMGKTSDYCT